LSGGNVSNKDGGVLKADLTRPRELVLASRDYLFGEVEPQAGWLPAAVSA
jgi:hypothetical protein